MVKKTKKSKSESKWAKFSIFFYDRIKTTFIIWLAILVFGALSFTTFLTREGFPPVQFPLSVVSGAYFVDDANTVDSQITLPISNELGSIEGLDTLQTQSGANFFTIVASFDEGFTSEQGTEQIKQTIETNNLLPSGAQIEYTSVNPAKFLNQYDLLLSVYSKDGQTAKQLEQSSNKVVESLATYEGIESAFVESQFSTSVNPFTGQEETRQDSFGRIGIPDENGQIQFYRSSTVGVNRSEDVDIIELSEIVNNAIVEIQYDEQFSEIGITIGADFAESIETQISALLDNLLTGLLAVAIISFILITWRASIITALFMVTVVLTSLGILYLVGYSLNTITLFGLVLSLGLFVDDATIIVEAIDARKRKAKTAREAVKEAIAKVASASFAGTFTTVLVFLPLVFISGVLGEFIYILPITVIIALVSSLIISLSLIPFLSQKILLYDFEKSKKAKISPINKIESKIAQAMANFISSTQKTKKRLVGTTTTVILSSAVLIIGLSGALFSTIEFNIFPPTKDADQILVSVTNPPMTSLEQSEDYATEVGDIIMNSIGESVVDLSFGAFSPATARNSDVLVELIPFSERDVKSPELVNRLTEDLESGFNKAQTRVIQIDAGPPSEQYPFKVQIYEEDPEIAANAALEIQEFLLQDPQVTRQNGTTANITDVSITGTELVARNDGKQYVQVQAAFDEDDITALTRAAKEKVSEEFNAEKEAELGLNEGSVQFDFGFESESQDSFNSLPKIGLLAFIAMLVLLAIQFRSIAQPILIVMAVPFSMLGVAIGLKVTDNPVSFFTMIGLFGLIGISVNNTILMTDYANQERRSGKNIVDSIASALQQRFRPLLATSLTTVAALTPLALSDPFWEGLAFTIIFGLLSSTLFVLITYPFYYIAFETIRVKLIGLVKRGNNG